MKDAYSFDADVDDLRASYQDDVRRVPPRASTRCGLTFRPVEAQAGEIGGDVNHEFMAVAAVGEDDFVWCTNCDYAANVEAARRGAAARRRAAAPSTRRAMEKVPHAGPARASRPSPSTSGVARASC